MGQTHQTIIIRNLLSITLAMFLGESERSRRAIGALPPKLSVSFLDSCQRLRTIGQAARISIFGRARSPLRAGEKDRRGVSRHTRGRVCSPKWTESFRLDGIIPA